MGSGTGQVNGEGISPFLRHQTGRPDSHTCQYSAKGSARESTKDTRAAEREGSNVKAFLSHSSKDKVFVTAMVDSLRPGSYELDSETFDFGLLNSQAILQSLERCDLFCLMLSSQSVTSSFVDFETLLGIEFIASGKFSRFLTICIDDTAFDRASADPKYFNSVRRSPSPETAARLIQGQLVSAARSHSATNHPFIGRDDEVAELGRQINDHKRPPSKALFISGNFGSGRRTIAQNFYRNYFPSVGQIFPVISVELFAGLEEFYQAIVAALRPTLPARQLLSIMEGFRISEREGKLRLIAQQLNALLPGREAAHVIDRGGVLTDAGGLSPELDGVLKYLKASPHPPVVFISPRMIPRKARRSEDDISYLAVKSLKREAAESIISRLVRSRDITLSEEEIEKLVQLSDLHPFNIYRMVEEIGDCGLSAFLANPSDFIDWKHRQSSEYLGKIDFEELEIQLLGILKIVPELDFTAIVDALDADASAVASAMLRLANLHVVESRNDSFTVSPPLRVAIERDRRIRLPNDVEQRAINKLAASLSLRLAEGTAPVVLIHAAVLASLQSGRAMAEIASAFLLPSHFVWMANKSYDERRWSDSIRYARKALEGKARLSASGVVGACRFMCLSSARIGEQATFADGIKILQLEAADDWGISNVSFLRGFNARLKGHLPEAERLFRRAYDLSPGNFSAAREIAAVCLERGNLQEGERFAREAHQYARRNPYLVDILVAILIRKINDDSRSGTELDTMFELLEEIGEEEGRSFYTTRKAEFEYTRRNNMEALRLIEIAINRTPRLFEPRRLHAEILLGMGNKVKAHEVIGIMRGMVNSRSPSDRRKNYRQYLQTYAHYLTEVNRFEEAKEVFKDNRFFTPEETDKEIRSIENVQAYQAIKERR